MKNPSLEQDWINKAERIKCPAPLPENPADPLLMKMLVPAPYQAPAKKDKKNKKAKEAQGNLHPDETSGTVSRGTEAPSSDEEDKDEDEEEEEE